MLGGSCRNSPEPVQQVQEFFVLFNPGATPEQFGGPDANGWGVIEAVSLEDAVKTMDRVRIPWAVIHPAHVWSRNKVHLKHPDGELFRLTTGQATILAGKEETITLRHSRFYQLSETGKRLYYGS